MVAAGLGVALVPASSAAVQDGIASVRVRTPLTIAMSALFRTDADLLVAEFIDVLATASRSD